MRPAALLLIIALAATAHAQPGVDTSSAAVERSAEEFDRLVAEADRGSDERAGAELGAQLLKTVLMLGAICAFAYLLLGKALPRVLALSPGARRALGPPSGLIEVVDRLPLDARRAFYVVKVGEQCFLVGLTDQGMSTLARLDLEAPLPKGEPERTNLFAALLARRQKES